MSGSFLTWFGIRSHIESSILLRLCCSSLSDSRSEDEMLELYKSRFGWQSRIEEACNAGLIDHQSGAITNKGKRIVTLFSLLQTSKP